MAPDKDIIIRARQHAGLTQTAAAALIGKKLRTWQHWELGDRAMDPALFELFCLKAGLNCQMCGHSYGADWLDDGETCPVCKLVH